MDLEGEADSLTQAKSTKFRANFALPRHALQNVCSGVPNFVPGRDSRLPHAQFSVWALNFMLSGSGFRSGLRQVQSDSGQTTAASAATEALGAL